MTRRRFLSHVSAALALSALPRRARASSGAVSASERRFLFVHAEGGWDPLVAFAPMFDAPAIDMAEGDAPLTVGDFALVDGPERPSVRAFFEQHHARTLLINGVSTRSVNHDTCQRIALTGSTSDQRADWGTLIASGARDRFTLPHVVVSGPSFVGDDGVIVSRAEGRLQDTITGALLEDNDVPTQPLSTGTAHVLDRFLSRRASGFALASTRDSHARSLADAYADSSVRARGLVDARFQVQLVGGSDVRAKIATAIGALRDDVCRCATVGTDFVWDSHNDNAIQAGLFESLFADLSAAMTQLATTLDSDGRPLADSTVLVVLSEMARTPAFNATGGRDHWPFTSALVVGPGVTGDRTIGGFTELFAGVGVDPATADLDPARPGVLADDLGATLLALGGVDPTALGVAPIAGVLT